jgi:hypothetical protein
MGSGADNKTKDYEGMCPKCGWVPTLGLIHHKCVEIPDKTDEQVDHPSHYNQGKIETITFIKDREHLGFCRLNAIKYIDRSGVKVGETKERSLRKAIWYLEYELGMHRKGEL